MTIKAGDLVMVVRPTLCCGHAGSVGHIFTARSVSLAIITCVRCRHESVGLSVDIDDVWSTKIERLKKIDPPADGDSLPTRKDIEVPA